MGRPRTLMKCGSALGLLLTVMLACRPEEIPPTQSVDAQSGPAPTASGDSTPADDGQWVRPGKDYQGTRFSGLSEITAGNASSLRVITTFSTGNIRGHEAAPIVADNTMFIVTPYPNVVYALDLTREGFPMKWSYHPKPAAASQGIACCDVVNRGGVYDNGRFFFNTLDGFTIALDARTGKEAWRTQVADIHQGETITMAPLVVKGRVLVGNSGGEMGVRGWVKALDES